MRTRPQPIFGPFARQPLVWAGVSFLVSIGRWIQGGDRPIAVPLRLLYAVAILAALGYVVRGFAAAFPRIYVGHRRIVRRARQRPGLTIYLGILTLAVLGAALSGIGRDLGILLGGGDVGIVGFQGDNSDGIKDLVFACLLLCDGACLVHCIAVERWRRSCRVKSITTA